MKGLIPALLICNEIKNRTDKSSMYQWSWLLVCAVLLLAHVGEGQYKQGTGTYNQTLDAAIAELQEVIQSNPETIENYYPEKLEVPNDGYVFDYPNIIHYRIGMLMDPCKFLPYNCCMNVFGTAEYPSLRITGHEQERVLKYPVLGSDEVVSQLYDLVYDDWSSVAYSAQRWSDDDVIIDNECLSLYTPHANCFGKNIAYKRNPLRPACTDNNNTYNSLSGCLSPVNGTLYPKCATIAYTQNTFAALCENEEKAGLVDHCGTYIEVHMPNGSPIFPETEILTSIKVETRNVSGFYSDMLSLLYKNDPKKILCSYSESFLRINSVVYVKDGAPDCCCPPPFKDSGARGFALPRTRTGSAICPVGPTGSGPFAYKSKTQEEELTVDAAILSYPFCPGGLDSPDQILCSRFDYTDRRHYLANCSDVVRTDPINIQSFTSDELQGKVYDGICPYFSTCALTFDNHLCKGDDRPLTFRGRVGKVVKLDDRAAIPQVWITFNDGRSNYQFAQEQVKLETYKSMYELWWVVRSKSGFTVQKRKGFNITEPICTFDSVNNRYYPYTMLDEQDRPIASYP